jgi:hypothetical protein
VDEVKEVCVSVCLLLYSLFPIAFAEDPLMIWSVLLLPVLALAVCAAVPTTPSRTSTSPFPAQDRHCS